MLNTQAFTHRAAIWAVIATVFIALLMLGRLITLSVAVALFDHTAPATALANCVLFILAAAVLVYVLHRIVEATRRPPYWRTW